MLSLARSFVVVTVSISLLYSNIGIAQPKDTADQIYSGPEFRRWSVVVSDLDKTINLYTEVLGFELGDVTTDPKDSYVYETFAIDPSITTRHATFHAGEAKRVISVVEVPGVKSNIPQSPRMSVALLNTKGKFDQIVTRLRNKGYKTLTPHALGKGGIEIGFIDGDGHLYALYEYPYLGELFMSVLTD